MITRTRLLGRISLAEPALWLIEAGAGFGKTILLDQLRGSSELPVLVTRRPIGTPDLAAFVTELAGAARRAGLDEAEAAISASEGEVVAIVRALASDPCVVMIDDADAWDEQVVALVASLVREVVDRLPLIVAGRSLQSFEGIVSVATTRSITATDLVFDDAELHELVTNHGGDPAAVSVVAAAAGGWPLAAGSLAAQVEASGPLGLEQLATEHENLIDRLLGSYLSALTDADIGAAARIAKLPFFDEHIAHTIGSPGLVTRLKSAGVPVTRRADGWVEIADQFRQSLLQGKSDASAPDPQVIAHFIDRGEMHAAIRVCLASGSHAQAAELIGSLSNDQHTRLDPSTLNAAIATIGEAANQAPRCLLVQGLVNASYGRRDDGLQAVERCVESFAKLDPELEDDAHREALLELGLWRYFTGQPDAAVRLLDRATAGFTSDSRIDLRARAHDLRGLLYQAEGTEDLLERSAAEMTEALRLWRSAGETRPAAATVFRLAGGALADLGRRGVALEILENLPDVGPMTLINRARLGLERSALLPYTGRASEVPAIVAEVRRLAGLLGHSWIVAWSYWTEIVAASVVADPDRVRELLGEFDRQGLAIGDEFTEFLMWTDVAEACARCGLTDQALQSLERARAKSDIEPWLLDYTTASLHSRIGEPDTALTMIESLDLVAEFDHGRRWMLEVLRGYAQLRSGNVAESNKFLDRAFELAADMAQPQLPQFVEQRIVAQIRAGSVAEPDRDASTVPTTEASNGGLHVNLFGGFQVLAGATAVDLPRGQVSELVKLLVLAGGTMVVDQVIDQVWPEAAPDVGKRRLRNLLGRLREHCPGLVERVGDSLGLGSDVTSDYSAAVGLAKIALGHDPGDGGVHDALDRAIRANRDELLPADLYIDWIDQARREHQGTLVRLLDGKAAAAEQDGALDATVEALVEAHHLEPFGNRLSMAVELLNAAGRHVAATTLTEQFST